MQTNYADLRRVGYISAQHFVRDLSDDFVLEVIEGYVCAQVYCSL